MWLTISWLAPILATCIYVIADTRDTTDSAGTAPPNIQQLSLVVERLSYLVRHYSNNEGDLNVDGLYGFRIAQGALASVVRNLHSAGVRLEERNLRSNLIELSKVLDRTCDVADRKIRTADPEYYYAFQPLIGSPFDIADIKLERLLNISNESPATSPDAYDYYNEAHGDLCFKKLMGTFQNKMSPHSYKCLVDRDCLDMMTQPSLTGYSLTHQLLYFIISRKVGCDLEMEYLLMPKKLHTYERELCRQILSQNDRLLSQDQSYIKDTSTLDLFIEQSDLCGMLGFTNFFDKNRLHIVLQHQNPIHGCFNMRSIRQQYHSLEREKRREMVGKDGCLAHTTGLAAGYMALYIKDGSSLL